MRGAGIVIEAVTEGHVPLWLGAAVAYAIVVWYVLGSGVTAIGWTNTFQGMFMMVIAWSLGLWLPGHLYGGVGPMFEEIMARRPELEVFAEKHGLRFITVAQLVAYRLTKERLVERIAEATLPTRFGDFRVIAYQSLVDDREHVALVKGDIEGKPDVLVRMHSECLTGDVFGSMRCDCGEQLSTAMERLQQEGAGAIVYLKQEGRGIGLGNKIRAYELQDGGQDTVEANEALGFKPDLRDYGIGAQILLDLGLHSIRILTNNPRKVVGLDGYDLEITGREPLMVRPGRFNADYLETKRLKMGHIL
ncbi:MAG: GTP cyclohydrolase II [Gemmatimonadetes bacterium]|nr:GTP cyclohydrolase II [Gemmatimonadota bacterium]